MPLLLGALMLFLLLHAGAAMSAASDACRLFVTAVLPGLFPYMVLSQMLVSRVKRFPPALVLLLGWGGGSPTGARLLAMNPRLPRKVQVRLMVSCATMSPMFLLGTLGGWLRSPKAGAVILAGVLLGGYFAGMLAGRCCRSSEAQTVPPAAPAPCSFGAAVEQSARTMLLVCGTMVMLRVLADLTARLLPPGPALASTTLLEVTTGTSAIAQLPLPLPWRTALLCGAAGFGGLACVMQNRALCPAGLLPLWQQLGWQAVHGAISFLIALGLMLLLC